MFLSLVVLCFAGILHSSTSIVNYDFETEKLQPVNLAYRCIKVTNGDTGSTDSTPILLLHGLGNCKESWDGVYQLLALKTNRKVCIADLRNHGDSPWNSDPSVAAMAEDISLLLEVLQTPKIILLGHSLGGKVAVHFALTYPTKVQKLIIEDMRPNGVTDIALLAVKHLMLLLEASLTAIPEGADETTAKMAIAGYVQGEMAAIGATGLVDETTIKHLPIRYSNGAWEWKTNIKLFEKVLENPMAFMSESSGLFAGPTLFLYGTISPFEVGEDESSIRKLFPRAKLIGLKGGGHFLHNRPDFQEAAIKFINEPSFIFTTPIDFIKSNIILLKR